MVEHIIGSERKSAIGRGGKIIGKFDGNSLTNRSAIPEKTTAWVPIHKVYGVDV